MTFGLYKHYKGGWYLGLWKATDTKYGSEQILYFSFKEREFYVRDANEFFGEVQVRREDDGYGHDWMFRFKKWKLRGEPCYCRELGAYEKCPKHGRPTYGNHKVLHRFDGHEHEGNKYRDIKSAVDKLDREGHLMKEKK